jgi:hypothetical protein
LTIATVKDVKFTSSYVDLNFWVIWDVSYVNAIKSHWRWGWNYWYNRFNWLNWNYWFNWLDWDYWFDWLDWDYWFDWLDWDYWLDWLDWDYWFNWRYIWS